MYMSIITFVQSNDLMHFSSRYSIVAISTMDNHHNTAQIRHLASGSWYKYDGLTDTKFSPCQQVNLKKIEHLPSKQSTSADVSLTSVQRQFNVELTLD